MVAHNRISVAELPGGSPKIARCTQTRRFTRFYSGRKGGPPPALVSTGQKRSEWDFTPLRWVSIAHEVAIITHQSELIELIISDNYSSLNEDVRSAALHTSHSTRFCPSGDKTATRKGPIGAVIAAASVLAGMTPRATQTMRTPPMRDRRARCGRARTTARPARTQAHPHRAARRRPASSRCPSPRGPPACPGGRVETR